MLAASPAQALITRLTPLSDVLKESHFIFTVKIESVDAGKPAIVLVVDEEIKGKAPARKMPVLFKPDAEAKKGKHVPLLLKRIAPKLPLVVFVLQRDKKYTGFAYTNGTWFQIIGVEADGKVRWSLTHGEPYLRKTYKGSTADLRKTIIDSLAGKAKPPAPDAKEKPGFGPEIDAKDKSEKRSAASSNLVFAVIPSVLVGGPLAILAMLFPAIFGGLTLVMRRWLVGLSVLSLNSTLYSAQYLCMPWLAGTWWGTPAALWLTMTLVTLVGILWAWRRHVARLATEAETEKVATEVVPPARNVNHSRVEWITLGALSAVCLAAIPFSVPRSLYPLDLWAKTLLTFSAGLWMALAHALVLRWRAGRTSANTPGVPGEGVMLWTMLLAAVAFGTTFSNESSGVGATEDESGPFRVAWRFRPPVERCWIASSPVVDGDRVYVGVVLPSAFKGTGAVYCLDRLSGKELWTFNDGGDMKDVFSSPCVAGGRVYIGEGFHQHADCKLYCLDAATGKKLWDFTTASHTEATPCVAGDKVYFGAGDDGLYCLDAASGKERWHLTGLHVDANPLVAGHRVYGGSGVGDAYKETVLFCLDADTGKEQWRMPMDLPTWGMAALYGEQLYVGIGNGNFMFSADQLEKPDKPAGAVLCLEAATGKRVWRYDVGDGVHVRVSVDARNVYFGSRDQYCYCLDRQEGTLSWKTDLGSPVLASPFLVQSGNASSLYAAGSDGRMSRLDASTGKIVWTFDVASDTKQPTTLLSSPAVSVRESSNGESRLIYFGCGLTDFSRGILYCLEENEKTASSHD
jgi:outer membrane protein assembly factor BamB